MGEQVEVFRALFFDSIISFYLCTEFYLQGKRRVAFKMLMLSTTEALGSLQQQQGSPAQLPVNCSELAADLGQHMYQTPSFLSL